MRVPPVRGLGTPVEMYICVIGLPVRGTPLTGSWDTPVCVTRKKDMRDTQVSCVRYYQKLVIRDFQKWLPSNKWRHCWGTEQTGTNDVTEYRAKNHL